MQHIANQGSEGRAVRAFLRPAIRHVVPWKHSTMPDCDPGIGTTDLLLGGMIKASTPSPRFSGRVAGKFVEAGDPEPGVGLEWIWENQITALNRNSRYQTRGQRK